MNVRLNTQICTFSQPYGISFQMFNNQLRCTLTDFKIDLCCVKIKEVT